MILRSAAALLLLFCVAVAPAEAQLQTTAAPAPRLRVFLDCDECDSDYVRREVPFVDYVRDRKDADVHILVTTQDTAAGGEEWVFRFLGLGRFTGLNDELKYASQQTTTDDEEREGYTRILKLGLVRYVSSTSVSDRLHVVYKEQEQKEAERAARTDRWNFWIFRIRASSEFEGEERESFQTLSGSFTGNRVTEAWKVNTALNLNFRENQFTLSSGSRLVDKSHDHSATALVVKSFGEHWSAAVRGRAASVTRLNQDTAVRAGAGVEYSFYPYRLSSRKQLTAQLTLGANRFAYIERTIFDRTSEIVGDTQFIASFDVTQPWGTADVTLDAVAYLHDFARHSVELDGELDARLFKGFSLNVGASISRIRNQIYLRAGDATDEEILLRRRQLATDYRYEFSVGLSYTFGSIFNNIVNTRF